MANQQELNQEDYNEFEFDYLKVEKLPSDVLNTLADKLPKHWMKLARFLAVSEEEIDRVLLECNTARERSFEIFNSWCGKNPDKTWCDLKSGLVFCGRNDVIIECEKKLTVRSVFGIQPSSEMLFLRKKELCEIQRYLFELQDREKSTLVIYGMSGVGKTQLAKKYCELYHRFYKNFVWIDAAFGNLQKSMINIGQKLGFAVQDSKGGYIDVEVIVEKIHNYYKTEKTLYIFDNVDSESVRNLETYISKKSNSFTLITSQWRVWTNNVNKMIINIFSAEEAFAYVKKYIKESTYESMRSLTKELRFHPFAITQAIKYINIHKISIEKYLTRYRSKPKEILDDDNFPTEEESKSAIKAINVVLIKLEQTKIIPLQILNCLSHCNGENISKEFIIQISEEMTINEEYLIDEAIRLLLSYSLLDSLDDENFSMHDLTQLSCRHFQSKKSSTSEYLDLIKNYFKLKLNVVEDHVDYGNHFVSHFIHIFRKNCKLISKTFHHMTTSIKNLLVCKGLFRDAIEILQAIERFNAEIYGENNDFTLNTKHNIANCLNEMGKYKEALEIYYSIDKIKTEILGINHLDTMSTKNNIAVCLFKMGKYNEALEIYYSVDKIQTETLGINHPDTMATKGNIASFLFKMGKYNEALEIYYCVNKIRTEILGINHRDTMATQHNIANCLNKMGKYNEALEICYFVDKIRTENLGIKHPDTMSTKHNIANCLYALGKYNEALETYCSVDKIETEVLGIKHPDTISTKHNIAMCFNNMGKHNEALETYYSVDKIKTEILGINHPDTISTKHNIAICLSNMGKYNEALEAFYSVEKIKTKILGIDHPDTMKTKYNIARCLIKMGKYSEASEIYYSVEKIQTEILGINHPDTMKTKYDIASCLYKMEKYNEALEIYYSVEKIQTENLGINHPDTLSTKHNIALCLGAMGKYIEALKIFYFVDKIRTETLGFNYADRMSTKMYIGFFLCKLETFNQQVD